ncbi:TonB-dependent receptor [Rhabdobacter roseus]|uniref:Iron complex outermembrane receptor protein/hemoglobin/transferrin/lactoferrin receptor protein n=1 Tax=Rhabdobacter roseus TaxID=1655419 RepID=A0A840TY98_9BACT|nr:TonB-dependent receptor [Rhabdobacter roseus]MBB5286537.1 iron complex outermembrane receptor protein/hemoglobin/transferrin/lactoferrin receptor protein [Rhabdobacter roseus]
MVTDAQSGDTLMSVSVQAQELFIGTTTDRDGKYRLQLLQPGTYLLSYMQAGYQTAHRTVSEFIDQELNVALQPDVVQLNGQEASTAQRYESRTFGRPEAITVLTRRDLYRNSLRSTPELLLGETGVFVQKTTHGGGAPIVRGLTGHHTLLLVDGIRLNNATYGSGPNQYLNTVDPFSLRRVEVLRGGGGVQYGSDAVGGAVQVFSQTPQFSDQTRVTGSALTKWMSSEMEESGRLSLGVSSRKVAVQAGFSYRNFGNLIGGGNLVQERTGYEQRSADVKAVLRLKPSLKLTAAYQVLRQDSVPFYPQVARENFLLSEITMQQRTLGYLRLEGNRPHRWLRHWQVTTLAQQAAEDRSSHANGSPLLRQEKEDVDTQGALASAITEPTDFWKIQTGLDWYFDEVASRRQDTDTLGGLPPTNRKGLYANGASQHSLGLYTLHTLTFARLTVTAGVRYNLFATTIPDEVLGEVQQNPSAWVGNAGLSVALWPSVRLVANVSSSFRAPNVNDLSTVGLGSTYFELPNGALRPERGLNKEVGLKIRDNRFSSSFTLYHNQLSDLIVRRQRGSLLDNYAVYFRQNLGRALIRGLEAEAEWQLFPNWLLFGNATYTHGQNLTTQEPLRLIPPLHGKLGVTYQRNARNWVRAEWWMAARQDRLAPADVADPLIPSAGTPGWHVINAAIGQRVGLLRVAAEIQNLLDQRYYTHGSGVTGVGRSLWVTLRFDW